MSELMTTDVRAIMDRSPVDVAAVADFREDEVRVWSGTQNPHVLRGDLALLLQRPETEIDVVRMEAAGCYGRNCADDVSADAVLLSRAVGRPVRFTDQLQARRAERSPWCWARRSRNEVHC